MPLIKPRTRGRHFVRQRVRLEQENHETLHAYAAFLGESPDYVLNQVVETVLGKDKDFAQWRTQHPHSHVPRPLAPRGGPLRGRRADRTPAAPPTARDTTAATETTAPPRVS